MYTGHWKSINDLIREFRIIPPAIAGITILLAVYGNDGGGYGGKAFVLFLKGNTLYEVNASHCSCNGLEGQWEPEETTTTAIRHRVLHGSLGQDIYNTEPFAIELLDILAVLDSVSETIENPVVLTKIISVGYFTPPDNINYTNLDLPQTTESTLYTIEQEYFQKWLLINTVDTSEDRTQHYGKNPDIAAWYEDGEHHAIEQEHDTHIQLSRLREVTCTRIDVTTTSDLLAWVKEQGGTISYDYENIQEKYIIEIKYIS